MPYESFARVAVLGLGTMGHAIAQSFAAAGHQVHGYDESPPARRSVHDRVRANLDAFIAAGLTTPNEAAAILERIRVFDSERAALADVRFVTEAVREELAAKQDLFARIEESVSDDAILASNSSTFTISQSGSRLRRPERALVTHWFNPPHIVPTVEVVPSPRTDPAATEATLALLRRLGKLAIHVRQEIPGFLVNRIQIAVMREVWDLLDRGVASVEDIDAAVRGSMGFRLAALGPLAIHDFGGLDIQEIVYRELAPDLRGGAEIPPTVRALIDEGHLGYKSGRGFYDYSGDEGELRRRTRDERYLQLLKLFHAPASESGHGRKEP